MTPSSNMISPETGFSHLFCSFFAVPVAGLRLNDPGGPSSLGGQVQANQEPHSVYRAGLHSIAHGRSDQLPPTTLGENLKMPVACWPADTKIGGDFFDGELLPSSQIQDGSVVRIGDCLKASRLIAFNQLVPV